MSIVRIGVAGAGVFGSYHAAKIDALDGVRFEGVYDTDPGRAGALAAKHGVEAFSDYTRFLDHIDAIVIAVPAVHHFELGEAALLAGKDVLIEKPLSTTTAAARALVKIAKDCGRILQVGHQERYVCESTGLFSRERAPQRIECVRHVPFTGRCGDVSAVMDLMVHDLDIVQCLCRSAVMNVNAEGVHDNVAAELFLASGTIATLSARRSAKTSNRRMVIVYDDGVIEFDFIRRKLSNTTPAKISSLFDAGKAPLSVRDPLAYGAELFVKSIADRNAHGVAGDDAAEIVDWARQVERAAGIDGAGDIDLRQRVRA